MNTEDKKPDTSTTTTKCPTGCLLSDAAARQPSLKLRRFENNPLLQARANHDWESLYVFNAASLYLEGKVHLIYRAIGHEGVSRLGYAASRDGVHIDERSDEPVYQSVVRPQRNSTAHAVAPPYASGGSWHGCEDPRLTQIGPRIYMTYTAFGGWERPPAVALTSISVDDFLAKKWHWSPARLVSPPGETHKNWVIFPATFNGKFAVLHSLAPDIQIDYVDSLDDLAHDTIKSRYVSSHNNHGWDTWIRGAGAPPIETRAGWLLLYHAMDRRDPNRYKLGAMLLDRNDPTRVLSRLSSPLLEPNARYENDGFKAGVIYNCGSALIGDRLFVYYGGADSVVCGSSISLEQLLNRLQAGG